MRPERDEGFKSMVMLDLLLVLAFLTGFGTGLIHIVCCVSHLPRLFP
jgi:hypothetical protein